MQPETWSMHPRVGNHGIVSPSRLQNPPWLALRQRELTPRPGVGGGVPFGNPKEGLVDSMLHLLRRYLSSMLHLLSSLAAT